MDHRSQEYLVVDEVHLRIGPMALDGLDQLDDIKQEVPIPIHNAMASA